MQAQKVGSGLHPPVLSHPPGLSPRGQSDEEVLEWEATVQEEKLDYLPNPSGLLLQLEKQRIVLEELKGVWGYRSNVRAD